MDDFIVDDDPVEKARRKERRRQRKAMRQQQDGNADGAPVVRGISDAAMRMGVNVFGEDFLDMVGIHRGSKESAESQQQGQHETRQGWQQERSLGAGSSGACAGARAGPDGRRRHGQRHRANRACLEAAVAASAA